MTNQASEDELEQHLLNDKAFQHILKFAPKSQRELMTFELSRYINALIRTEKLKLLDRLSSHQEDLFWWTGGEYEKTKAVDMRAISAERDKLAKMEAEL